MKNPKRSTFLKAAELQLKYLAVHPKYLAVHPGHASMWACLNIEKVTGFWDLNCYVMPRECKAALEYFEKYFGPTVKNAAIVPWWGGVEDNEARVIALLLCAEMLRE